ncbi:hypothetical protein ASG49_16355 [Marmoricola sp. Leaf446]|uniref:hypothetical protein n=1 Tax=Marmoricola sp. Leaf446 TaxID=1736379 RepID=UPI0006F1FE20|nr:hypothetical protein [Marmoricola sp. Leaf446]KQT89349.1 hypothetical protein ASG49_16355 [Marmoricola sp. Leaf446]
MSPALGRLLRPTALTVSTLVLLAGCGSSQDPASSSPPASESASASESSGSSSPSPSSGSSASSDPEEAGTVVAITIADGTASPQGKAMQVAIGEPVTLRVESDAPGELHIHSTPEQELSFEAGTTEDELTFDRPGVVDVESHDLGQLLVRLEVR